MGSLGELVDVDAASDGPVPVFLQSEDDLSVRIDSD